MKCKYNSRQAQQKLDSDTKMHTHEITCVWTYFPASTAAILILWVSQVVTEVGHAVRLVEEAVAMSRSRKSLPNFVLSEAKHSRKGWERDRKIHGDQRRMLREEEHLQETEGAVPVVGEGRVKEGQIECCWNPNKSILRHETREHPTPEAIAKLAV